MVEALLEQAPWLTPTSLFLILNVVIATILLSSAYNNHHKKPLHGAATSSLPPGAHSFARTPSLFSRVTSFNFSNYYPDPNLHLQHLHSSPSFFSRVASFNFSDRADEPGSDEALTRKGNVESEPKPIVADIGQNHKAEIKAPSEGGSRTVARAPSLLSRVASFTLGARGPPPVEFVAFGKNGRKEEEGRVKMVKKKKKAVVVEKETATFGRGEKEVDTKADDFINRFKQQLKLQRIESLMRYRSA